VKLVHLVGFITKKFVRMHGHMNVKLTNGVLVSASLIQSAPSHPISLYAFTTLPSMYRSSGFPPAV